MSPFDNTNDYDISDLLSEEEKNTEEYLKSKIDNVIATLFTPKQEQVEAYNYFAGKRTRFRNQWIFDMQGIENPYDIPFISLIRPRLNVLLGIQLDHPINYKVTTIGSDVYRTEQEERKTEALNKIYNELNSHNKTILDKTPHLYSVNEGKITAPTSKVLDKSVDYIKYSYGKDFTTTLQGLCNTVLDYYIYNKDLKHKILELFKHLLITGTAYYRNKIVEKGRDPEIEIVNPLHFYHSKATNTSEVNTANECFYIKYMTKVEVLNMFGHNLDQQEREKLVDSLNYLDTYGESVMNPDLYESDPSLFDNEYGYLDDNDHYKRNLYKDYIPVYFVEWLANNEVEVEEKYIDSNNKEQTRIVKRFRLDRYEGVRVGGAGEMYFNMKKSDNVVRSVNDPYTCTLSFNGTTYSEFNSKPYSMVTSLIPIQDQYDTNYYIRENMLARAHAGGTNIDFPSIPTFLGGGDPMGRVYAHQALIKNGINLTDSSQLNVNQGGQNVGSYGSNIDGGVIQAFDYVLDRYDTVASEITGVNRQMLGQFQERDGATVSKQALAQASLQTKEWYAVLDKIVGWLLKDLLDMCRFSYQEGHRGEYLLGGLKKVFTITPQFKTTDMNVTTEDGNKDFTGLQEFKQYSTALIQNQQIGALEMIKVIKAKSLAEAEDVVQQALNSSSGQELQQARQQLQELQAQLEELQKQVSEKDKMELEMKMREQARKEKETLIKENKIRYDQLLDAKKNSIDEKAVDNKDVAMERRDDIELQEAVKGGRSSEVENLRI